VSTALRVTVKLFAGLEAGRAPVQSMELAPGTTVAGLQEMLAIAPGAVTLHFVNGRHADPGTVLRDGDTLACFPPVGGG
jgi:molybdopterin converting factor small subunit